MKTFIQKIKNIINKLVETNFDFFDGSVDEACEFLEKRLISFPDYANVVIREQICLPMWRLRLDPEDFRINVQEIDRQRRDYHEAAIDAVNILNRLCAAIEVEPFSDIDTTDRHAVADMVGDFVIELYREGIGNSGMSGMDGATYEVRDSYDTSLPGGVIRGIVKEEVRDD